MHYICISEFSNPYPIFLFQLSIYSEIHTWRKWKKFFLSLSPPFYFSVRAVAAAEKAPAEKEHFSVSP